MAASWGLRMPFHHAKTFCRYLPTCEDWKKCSFAAHYHRRFGTWSQYRARHIDDDTGARPRKMEYVNAEAFQKEAPKSGLSGRGMSVDFLLKLQKSWDFSPGSIRNWFWRRRHQVMVETQSSLPSEWAVLGMELAAAHFVVSVDGGVRFTNQKKWIRKENEVDPILPKTCAPGAYIEAIDLSGTEILYEGFRHFERLNRVQWLNLRKCRNVDDWFLDRVSSVFRHTLTHLDISECQQITERGLSVLHRLRNLKSLKISGLENVKHGPLVCILLEEALPQCNIEGIDYLTPKQTMAAVETSLQEDMPAAK